MKNFFNTKNLLVLLIIISFVFTTACSNDADNNDSEGTNQGSEEVVEEAAYLELLHELDLGAVSEENIPDITSEERWSVDIVSTSPIITPNGKNVLTLQEDVMKWFNVETGELLWEKQTYGGISDYLVTNEKIFMAEKYASKKSKDEGNIICLDANTGEESWKYNIDADLIKVAEQYMPEDASWNIYCSMDLIADEEKLYAVAYTSWKVDDGSKKGKKDKVEVLEAIDLDGNKLWQTDSHGYPGMVTMSDMALLEDIVVMGNYSYGDDISGPAGAHAYNIETGELAWDYDLPNDPDMAYSGTTNTTVGVVGDKVVLTANFGKVVILDSKGNVVNEFNMYEPESYEDVLLITTSSSSGTVYGNEVFAVAPSKTYIQGSSKSSDAPAQHSEVGMLKIFDLEGNVKWEFRLGGSVSSMYIKGDYLIISTFVNEDTFSYDYCGVYVFDMSQAGTGEEINIEDESSLDKFVGYYQTDGAIIYDSLAVSTDGKVIAATTFPTKVDVEKHGEHALYLLEIK